MTTVLPARCTCKLSLKDCSKLFSQSITFKSSSSGDGALIGDSANQLLSPAAFSSMHVAEGATTQALSLCWQHCRGLPIAKNCQSTKRARRTGTLSPDASHSPADLSMGYLMLAQAIGLFCAHSSHFSHCCIVELQCGLMILPLLLL